MRRLVPFITAATLCLAGCRNHEPLVQFPIFPSQEEDFGWTTETVEQTAYSNIYYVSAGESDENGNGSRELPFGSISDAVEKGAASSGSDRVAILVASGNYLVTSLHLLSGIHLFGGFDPDTWERDVDSNRTILTGEGNDRILVGANRCRIDGFMITGGSYRGNGGAIYCDAVEMEISNNFFFDNTTLEPIPWAPEYIHEKAHDGGAVYAENGASLLVRGNIFWRNTTENGRGASVALHHDCHGEIRNNLFLENTSGLKDLFRSSDGGAVSVFDRCNTDITHNLFIGNRALNKNDGGALFYALWSSGTVHGNYFLNNRSMDDAGALFVGGQEHRYDAPLDPLPPAEDFFVTIDANVFMGNRNPSLNSGAFRITMESRGSVTNNLIAFNNGAYFQRSELDITQNTIVDNLLLVETKEGLNNCKLNRNIVLGDVRIETDVDITDCLFPEDIQTGQDLMKFRSDGFQPHVIGGMVGENRIETRFVTEESFNENVLKNRIVRSGDRFTLVKENRGSELIVYGDFSDSYDIKVMPTYTPEYINSVIGSGSGQERGKDLYGNERSTGTKQVIGAVALQESRL